MNLLIADAHVRLKHGKVLAYREYGHPDGQPLLYLHSNPGTRWQFPLALHRLGRSNRIIVPDRPGYGASTPPAGDNGNEFLDDAASLCAGLGIASLRVIGYSTGAAYALALASGRLPVSDLLLITPLVPGLVMERASLLPAPLRTSIETAARGNRELLDAWTRAGTTAPAVMEQLTAWLHADDQALLADPETHTWLGLDQSEAADGGMAGMAADYAFLACGKAVDPAGIACPVRIWSAALDPIAPPAISEDLAGMLDDVEHRIEPTRGHLLPFACMSNRAADFLATGTANP